MTQTITKSQNTAQAETPPFSDGSGSARGLGLARLVFERASGFHESAGPWEGGKIGFAIGERVFWTDSYSFPGDNTASHAEKVAFAQEIVLRLNAPAAALSRAGASS